MILDIFFQVVNKYVLVNLLKKVIQSILETLTKTKKDIRKKIRNRLLSRAANRSEKKTWTRRSERQDIMLTTKRKDTTTAAWIQERSRPIYLNSRVASEEKIKEVQEEEKHPFKPTSRLC